MTKTELITEIKSWLKDFEATTPSNLAVYDSGSTFELDAYQLLSESLEYLEEK